MNITFREFETKDVSFLVTCLNNENITRYLSSRLPKPYAESDALWWINKGCKDDHLGFIIEFDDLPCGAIGIYLQQDNRQQVAEIGYWLAEEYWGKGIATRAVHQFVDFVFTNTVVTKIFNPVTKVNTGSIRVMQKSGFEQEKIISNAVQHEGEWYDEIIFIKNKPLTLSL